MDRFEAAKWMVEHPYQRMVDSDGDEWWFDNLSEDFRINGASGNLFCECVNGVDFERKAEPVKPQRIKTKTWRTHSGTLVVSVPERFEDKRVEVRVKVCDD